MIKRIHCLGCGESWSLHPVDVGNGISSRKRHISVKKPKHHARTMTTHREGHLEIVEHELSSIECDSCGQPIPDGQLAYAITIWHPEETPTDWESEYGTVR